MIKIAVSGACGKMGARIIGLVREDKNLKVSVALEQDAHAQIGKSVSGIKISSDPSLLRGADCLIEFTSPLATLLHLEKCIEFQVPMVIGTTGFDDEQKKLILKAAKKIPIVFSPNMSIGVNILFSLVEQAARKLDGYNVKITEAHHVHKKDAPSGTAKKLAEVIKNVTGKEIKDIRSIREGEIIGDHDVVFESALDTIKLSHSAHTRDIFAKGALTAAKWLVGKKPGLYTMQEVISL